MTSLIARIERLRFLFVRRGVLNTEGLDVPKVDESWRRPLPTLDDVLPDYVPPLLSQPSFSLPALVKRDTKEKRMGTFQVFKDKTGAWRWRLRAANSRVIAKSESYTRKYDAVRAVQAIDRALKPGYMVDLPE